MWGWLVWADLAEGNWLTFLYDSYRQIYWPPLHSWALALAMLVLGPSVFVTGLVSLLAYAATGMALGAIALHADRHRSWTAPAVAVGLWLTAGNLVNRYATEAFTETVAMAATAGALLLLARALNLRSRPAWALAGIAAMLVYLTKTDYGILLMLATAIALLLPPRPGGRRVVVRSLVPWAIAIAVVAAIWFAYPPKILFTISALVNREQGPPILSPAGLAFHFAALVRWSDGILVWGLGLLALGATLYRPRTDLLRVIAVYVGLALLLHTLSQTKDEKHIVKAVPWLFVLVGVQAARLRIALATGSRGALAGGVLAGVLAVLGLIRGADFVRKTTARSPEIGPEAIAGEVAARIRPDLSHLVIGASSKVSPHAINWMVLGNLPTARIIPDPMTKTGYSREAFQEKMSALRRRVPLVRVLEPGREGPRYRIGYLLPKRRHEGTDAPAILERLLRLHPDRVLVLSLVPGSPWDTEDYRQFNHPGAAFLPYLQSRTDLRLREVLSFPEQGVRLFVLDRRTTGGAARADEVGPLSPEAPARGPSR